MKAERFKENSFPESHPIFTRACTDPCPVPQKHLTRLHLSGKTDCLVNEMSQADTAWAVRGLFPNYLKWLSTGTEPINNKEHFGRLEAASGACGSFPVQRTHARELHLLGCALQNKWVTKAISPGQFVLCGSQITVAVGGASESSLVGVELSVRCCRLTAKRKLA